MKVYAGHFGPEGIEFPDRSHAVSMAIAVRTLGGSLIPLYSDRHRSAIVSNPVMTDEFGNLEFYAEPGECLITTSAMSRKITVPEDPLEPEGGLTSAEREAIIDDAVEEVMEELETPITPTILFENTLSQ